MRKKCECTHKSKFSLNEYRDFVLEYIREADNEPVGDDLRGDTAGVSNNKEKNTDTNTTSDNPNQKVSLLQNVQKDLQKKEKFEECIKKIFDEGKKLGFQLEKMYEKEYGSDTTENKASIKVLNFGQMSMDAIFDFDKVIKRLKNVYNSFVNIKYDLSPLSKMHIIEIKLK